MRIYYAHHTWKYNTPIEDFEMACIRKYFDNDKPKIINPKDEISQDKAESEIMQDCYKAIDGCDALVFSTCSGMVGHGVFNEIVYALNAGKRVFNLHGTGCYEIVDRDIGGLVTDYIFRGDNRMYAVLTSPF